MIETESTVELELPLPGAGAGATSFAPWNVVGAPAVVDGWTPTNLAGNWYSE